jgi:hypothetical protein
MRKAAQAWSAASVRVPTNCFASPLSLPGPAGAATLTESKTSKTKSAKLNFHKFEKRQSQNLKTLDLAKFPSQSATFASRPMFASNASTT